jgi:hypothetical protein
MKRKLCKNRKQYSLLKVVLYSNEGESNRGCSWDINCNVKIFCGRNPTSPASNGINVRCNPPESTQDGARNVRCNLAVNC